MKNAALPPGKTASHFYPTATPTCGTQAKSFRLSPRRSLVGILTRERGVKLIFLSIESLRHLDHGLARSFDPDGVDCGHAFSVGSTTASGSVAAGDAAGYPRGACRRPPCRAGGNRLRTVDYRGEGDRGVGRNCPADRGITDFIHHRARTLAAVGFRDAAHHSPPCGTPQRIVGHLVRS